MSGMASISDVLGENPEVILQNLEGWLEEQYPAAPCGKCGRTAPCGPAGLCDPCLAARELSLKASQTILRRLPASLHRAALSSMEARGNMVWAKEKLTAAMRGRWSVYLHGGVGAGKTTMAAACFRALAHQGVDVWWESSADMFSAVKETWKSGAQVGEGDLIRWRVESALGGALFLDDLGVGKIQPWELAALSCLVDKLYTARRPDGARPWVWITSNRDLDGLRRWLAAGAADGIDADRVVSRLAEMMLPLQLTAGDYRVERREL